MFYFVICNSLLLNKMATAASMATKKVMQKGGLASLWDASVTITISQISEVLYEMITNYNKTLELRILIGIGFALWTGVDLCLRFTLPELRVMKRNPAWLQLIENMMNFFILLGIFLVSNLILKYVVSQANVSGYNTIEFVFSILPIVITGFTYYQLFKSWLNGHS